MNVLKAKIAEKVREKAHLIYENQKCPNSFVEIEVMGLTGVGYSKVSWPDEWDEDFGMELAYTKAVFDITKQVLKSSNVEEYLAELGVES